MPPSGGRALRIAKSCGRTSIFASASSLSAPFAPNTALSRSKRPWKMLTSPRKFITNSVFGLEKSSFGDPICSMRPLFMTTTWSDTSSASSWSCVTKMEVTLIVSWRWRSQWRSEARTCASSAPNGSSRRRTFGSMASARASATRWRCPPESSSGYREPRRESCTRSSMSATRFLIVALSGRSARGLTVSPNATLSATVIWRKSA